MNILGRIFFGGLATALGVFLVAKTEWLVNNFGRIEWAETHLHASGGSRIMYKLIGLLIIFLAFMYITGMWGSFMSWLVGPLTKHMIR